MVFKDADTRWRRARRDIAALLRGRAVPRRHRRRSGGLGRGPAEGARRSARSLLIVVSDGCPMDGATHLANDAQLLDRHLRQVVQRHERAGRIEHLRASASAWT